MRASTCAPFSSSALSSMKLCTRPNSHKLLGITKSAPTTSLCTGTRHVIRGQVSSRDNKGKEEEIQELRTCRICKKPFQPVHNHPQACRYHTAHFGGETKRKFESVYTGGTLTTVGGGEIVQYWHCCGVTDPFDGGCEAAPHVSYDD
ncbi:unnamed protein product [Sphagnum troendelagicum]|uniref:Uncharacterized protein n=1 Tax=Sphagnum troendelagicum TaxID=128251 RepID=A0ABP0TYP6_9BRYO